MTMAGLRNSIRSTLPATIARFIPVGDAQCHTDPVLALGLSFALVQAAALADAITEGCSEDDLYAAVHERTGQLLQERYDHATELDVQRLRRWNGEDVDLSSRDGAYALFTVVAGGVAAFTDPELFRTYVRRIGGLDRPAVLDDDVAMQHRIEEAYRNAISKPGPPVGPSAEEMEAIISLAH